MSGRNAATAAGGNEPADASNEPDAGGHGTGPDAAAGDGGAIVEPCAPDDGKCIFRHDTFGDEQLWTKTLRLQDLVQTLSPKAALSVGLKVDSEAVPANVLATWSHPPYFHDGSAPTFADVVTHYDGTLHLSLTAPQKADLVAYLKSL